MKSPVTQERVNLAEKAHIYSFSADGPRGNRGVDAKPLDRYPDEPNALVA